MREQRLGRRINVGKSDIFGLQPRPLDELAGFQHRAEADGKAARPITYSDLLLRLRDGCGKAKRDGEREQKSSADHVGHSSNGVASSAALSSAASATAAAIPTRGCGSV